MGLLGKQSGNDDKPLFRNWAKKQSDAFDPIISMKLSRSEEWIIIEGESSIAFLSAESKVGKGFWEQAQQFEGEAFGLMLVPAKGKLGFDIEVMTVKGFWETDADDVITFDEVGSKGKITSITSPNLWLKMKQAKDSKADETPKPPRASDNPSNNRRKRNNAEISTPEAFAPESDG